MRLSIRKLVGPGYRRTPWRLVGSNRVRAFRPSYPTFCRSGGSRDRPRPQTAESIARVAILEAHDIVLAKIITGLHLDDFQRVAGQVFKAMPGANGNVGRFIGVQVEHAVAVGDMADPAYHHPVLRAAMVHLQ